MTAESRSASGRRILLATTGLHAGGGIASVSRCIARAIAEEVEAGRLERLDTVSLNDEPGSPRPSVPGEHCYARRSRARFAFHLWRSIRRHDPDLVVIDHAGLARVLHLPLPGLPPRVYAVFAHGGELDVIHSGLRRRAIAGARTLLANSDFTAKTLRRQFPEIAGRVQRVLLCIDPELVACWRDLPRAAPGERARAILIVGRMWSDERGKGHDALLAALPRVRKRVPGAELWIVGEGDDLPRLEALAAQLGVADAVRFERGVSDAELGRLYGRAGVFAMPSRQEGFGLVYAEAMWHGLPCIGSTADAAVDVIEDGRTGLLVPYDAPGPLADAIASILTDHALAERMGVAAAEDARRRFGYARFRDDLLAALDLAPSEAGGLL